MTLAVPHQFGATFRSLYYDFFQTNGFKRCLVTVRLVANPFAALPQAYHESAATTTGIQLEVDVTTTSVL